MFTKLTKGSWFSLFAIGLLVGCATTRPAGYRFKIPGPSGSFTRAIVPDTLNEANRKRLTVDDLEVSVILPGEEWTKIALPGRDSTLTVTMLAPPSWPDSGFAVGLALERGSMAYIGDAIGLRAYALVKDLQKQYYAKLEGHEQNILIVPDSTLGGKAFGAFSGTLGSGEEVVIIAAAFGSFLDIKKNPAQLLMYLVAKKELFLNGCDRTMMGVVESLRVPGAVPFAPE